MRYRNFMRFRNREKAKPEPRDEGVSGVLGVAADRIQDIVTAAERAVADIRAEAAKPGIAESESKSDNDRERRVSELAAALVSRAEDLSRDAQGLANVLERASSRLAPVDKPSETSDESDETPQKPVKPTQGPAPQIAASPELSQKVNDRFESRAPAGEGKTAPFKRRRSSTPSDEKPGARQPSTDGLRLLATQMAVAGSTRAEIEARLVEEFGVKDADAILGSVTADGGLGRRMGASDDV